MKLKDREITLYMNIRRKGTMPRRISTIIRMRYRVGVKKRKNPITRAQLRNSEIAKLSFSRSGSNSAEKAFDVR